MKEKHIIRTLKPEEIECRIGLIRQNGLSLLLYKDARIDQKMLDETFGSMNWTRKHEEIGGSVYCTVSVKNEETGEWISKQDVGTSGNNMEREKSLASDSFKRACVNWGIGRELYTAPFIWISAKKVSIRQDGNRFVCNDRFKVVEIGYTGQNEIASIVIEKEDGQRVFAWQQRQTFDDPKYVEGTDRTQDEPNRKGESGLTQQEKKSLAKELERTGVTMDMVDARFHVTDPAEISKDIYRELMKALAATQSKQVA